MRRKVPGVRDFLYGLKTVDEAVVGAERLASEGLFVIANETIDIYDGGVSGVVQGDIVEFAPDDTPRCVEKPGIASLPRAWAFAMLRTIYGFEPNVHTLRESRLEFSIHPKLRGWKQSHTLAWEFEELSDVTSTATLVWPNRFSRHIGDKAFGLLMAELAGANVPRTTVFGRRVAPFRFGRPTGSLEVWTRTCPHEPDPGRFPTLKGWTDPFRLMAEQDPEHCLIASILCQVAVPAAYSGAAIVTIEGQLHIEGLPGEGDGLMLGRDLPKELPETVKFGVAEVFRKLSEVLGDVRFEWVHDGQRVWVVQLHRGATQTSQTVLVPGEADQWHAFEADRGLEPLRAFLKELPHGAGVRIEGDLGLTSHIADLIRRSNHPARLCVQL